MSIRKANYKRLLILVLAMCMLMGVSLTASAHPYDLDIPYPYAGGAQHTALYTKKTNATPYVQPSVNTISTKYYLAPYGDTTTAATNTITTGSTVKKDFTWNSGYGGTGASYQLVAYPGVLSNYETYNVNGTWFE